MPFHRGTMAGGFLGTVPGPPGTPTATTCTNAQSVLSWTAPANDGGSTITDYVVQYSTSATFASSVTTFADGTTGSTGATVTGLTNGTPYYFRVAAVNAYGTSSYSGISTVITPATVPNAPTSVVGTSHTNGESSVSWVAPSGAGTGGNGPPFTYTVQYSTSATFASAVTTFGTTSSSSPLIVNGLTNGTTYYFRVKATNCAGDSSYSTISAGAVPSTVPSAPATPTVNALDAGDTITWTAPANGGRAITGYYYKVSTNDGGYSAETFVAAGATLSYAAANQYSTSTKKIQVRAENANGSSGFSTVSANTVAWAQTSQVQTHPDACPPPTCAACNNAPTNCTACDNAPTNCGGCTAPDCSGGCSCDCGTASRTATAGTRAAATSGTRAAATSGARGAPTLGTNTRTCHRWERPSVGSTASGYVYNAGGTTACSAFPGCTAGTCGECAAGACGECGAGACGACGAGSCSACSACSDSFVSASPVTACVYATGFDGALSGYYSQNFLGSGFIWYGAGGCGDATGCGGGVNGTLDMRYCGSGAGAGQWRAYGFACVDVSCC